MVLVLSVVAMLDLLPLAFAYAREVFLLFERFAISDDYASGRVGVCWWSCADKDYWFSSEGVELVSGYGFCAVVFE